MSQRVLTLPPCLRGEIQLPASKSISARALVLGALSGTREIRNLSDCEDTCVMRQALQQPPRTEVDVRAAGTAMRFLTALFATSPGEERLLTGTQRMRERPIGVLVQALRSLGADIQYTGNEGFPPLKICGKRLGGGSVTLPADVSSQYISALLMTGPLLRGGLTLQLIGEVASRPYIDMTLALMRRFGACAKWTGERSLAVAEGGYTPLDEFCVEPDWSAASYWYELVALSPDPAATIRLPRLSLDSLQGDHVVATMFEALGVSTETEADGIVLRKNGKAALESTWEADFADCPDLAQTLAVTCALLGKPFHFTGLQSLRIKETDRIAALQNELAKLGLHVEASAATLTYTPQPTKATCAPPPTIATYADHRMALAFAPAAWRHPGLRISDPGVVAKSYPAFWSDLAHVGAKCCDI